MKRLTRAALAEILDREGIPSDAYSLTGDRWTEEYVLDPRPEGWIVYYSERGLQSGLRVFDDENQACGYLLALLLKEVGGQEERQDGQS